MCEVIKMTIRKFGDPVLKEKSMPVEKVDREVKKTVKLMIDAMKTANGVGLAAPQIGILKQIIIFDIEESPICLINPEIFWESKIKVVDEEGCLSVPGVIVPVERAKKIKVRALNIKGKQFEVVAEGLIARIIQHEVDHVNGVLIIDRTTKDEKRRVLKELSSVPAL